MRLTAEAESVRWYTSRNNDNGWSGSISARNPGSRMSFERLRDAESCTSPGGRVAEPMPVERSSEACATVE